MANFAPVLGQGTKEIGGDTLWCKSFGPNQLPEASTALRAPRAMEEGKAGREKTQAQAPAGKSREGEIREGPQEGKGHH